MVLQPLLGFSTDIDVAQYCCTIEFPSPENSGVAVGISSLSSIVLGISKFFNPNYCNEEGFHPRLSQVLD